MSYRAGGRVGGSVSSGGSMGGGGGMGGSGGGYKARGRSSPYVRNGGNRKNWNTPNRSGGKGGNSPAGVGRPEVAGVESGILSPQQEMTATPIKEPLLHEVPQPDTRVVGDSTLQAPLSSSGNVVTANSATPRLEKKCSVKSRLFIGNLPRDTKETQVKEMFEEFGEVIEIFVQKEKGFGFVRMSYRSDAENAVSALNGKIIHGRDIKVRFAASNSSVKVSNMHPTVSNELLEEAFSQFGDVEKAVVVTDERGKSLGHGVVDFTRKSFALTAIRKCTHEHYLLTKSPMPVLVTEFVRDNDDDGQPEKSITRNSVYRVEREIPPRFSEPGSVEYAVASQWKATYESEKHQREELEQQLRQSRNNVLHEMEGLKEQHQTELIRQELAHHQQEQLRLVQELRMRQGNVMPPVGSFMDGAGLQGGGPGYPMQGMEMNQEQIYESPSLLGSGGMMMGMGGMYPPPSPVPVHSGGPPPDAMPTSGAPGLAAAPPPPLMGPQPGASANPMQRR